MQERYGIFYIFSNPRDLLTRVISLIDLKHQVSYNEARVSNIRLAKDVLEALTKCERLSTFVRDNLAVELESVVEQDVSDPSSDTKVIPFMRKLVNPNESK